VAGPRETTVTLRAAGELVAHARIADGLWSRTRGLIGVRALRRPDGLLIPRCSSVHTFFMSIPIDLVYLDEELEVVKVVAALRPWRFSFGGRAAAQTLELPAGEAARLSLTSGQRIDAATWPQRRRPESAWAAASSASSLRRCEHQVAPARRLRSRAQSCAVASGTSGCRSRLREVRRRRVPILCSPACRESRPALPYAAE
jgi:uncharacterized membrane protein (UPF0127 family)